MRRSPNVATGDSGSDLAKSVAVGCVLVALGACAQPPGELRVAKLRIEGVHNVDRRELVNGLALQPTRWWSFRKHRIFDELLIDGDRDRILRYYQAHGYFNAEVTGVETVPRSDKRSLEVVFVVEEGPPTKLEDIRVTGADDLPDEASAAIEAQQLKMRADQRFVHARYLEFKDRLLGVLKERGYAWATVEGAVHVDRSSNLADIDVALTPGRESTISEIEVMRAPPAEKDPGSSVGAFRIGRPLEAEQQVDPRLIENRFGITPGRRFRWSDLEEGHGRVMQLGVFSTVMLSYRQDPAHVDRIIVRLRVTDTSLHELRLGGGIGIEAQRNELRLQLLYIKRNFLGGLRTLELRVRPAYVVVPAVWAPIVRHGPALQSDLVFTQPELGVLSRLQLTLGYDVGVEHAYQYHGPRTQIAIARLLWHDRISLSLAYNFQFLDFFATSPEILSDPTHAGTMYGYLDPYRLAWLQQDFRIDGRDSVFDPRRGGYGEISFEEGGPYTGSAFTYEKMRIGARGYAPLGSRVVLAGRIEFAQIWSQGQDGSPITRRLALGGGSSHRGFSEGRLAPQVPVARGAPLPIGGDQSLLASLDLRVDLVRLAGNMLAAAAFVDAGDVGAARGDTVSGWARGVDIAHLHCAVGSGLRYRTPIGTVRADVGVRLNRLSARSYGRPNPDPGDRIAFHISLAEAF